MSKNLRQKWTHPAGGESGFCTRPRPPSRTMYTTNEFIKYTTKQMFTPFTLRNLCTGSRHFSGDLIAHITTEKHIHHKYKILLLF